LNPPPPNDAFFVAAASVGTIASPSSPIVPDRASRAAHCGADARGDAESQSVARQTRRRPGRLDANIGARHRTRARASRSVAMTKKVVLVTGGSGLVGSAIREVIAGERPENEEWIFASSKVRDVRREERASRRSKTCTSDRRGEGREK
jgi:hypothetical protein